MTPTQSQIVEIEDAVRLADESVKRAEKLLDAWKREANTSDYIGTLGVNLAVTGDRMTTLARRLGARFH